MLTLKIAVAVMFVAIDNHPVYVMLCKVVQLPICTHAQIEKFKLKLYGRKFIQYVNFLEFTVTEATAKFNPRKFAS